jgi:hypothetical protein
MKQLGQDSRCELGFSRYRSANLLGSTKRSHVPLYLLFCYREALAAGLCKPTRVHVLSPSS